jgi:hypothetical protein
MSSIARAMTERISLKLLVGVLALVLSRCETVRAMDFHGRPQGHGTAVGTASEE